MDYMIDIETLGTKPGSIIASIGVIEFSPHLAVLGREMFWSLNIELQAVAGFKMEVGTVKWWMKQSLEAKRSTFFSPVASHLKVALIELRQFMTAVTSDAELSGVWANSPSFDLAHLEHAFDFYGIDAPWTYKQPRDCRTLFASTRFNYAEWSDGRGIAHSAIEDARVQALGVIEAHKAIK